MNIITIPYVIIALFCTVFFFSCGNEVEPAVSVKTGNLELDKFFQSKVYTEFTNNFGIDIAYYQFSKMEILHYQSKGVNVFSIPIVENEVKLGHLCVFSKNNGTTFNVLYEDLKQLDLSSGGIIRITTSKNECIANLTVSKQGPKYITKMSNFVQTTSTRFKEAPLERYTGESYLECVRRVFKLLEDTCLADPLCYIAYNALPGTEQIYMATAGASCLW